MSSRRRNFCFLNLLNLALSPFCDDICPRSSNLFETQRAEDQSVRSSIRQATDGRCEAQGTLRRNPLQRLRVRLLGLLPWLPTKCSACPQHTLFFERSAMSLRTRKLGPTQRPSRGSRETVFPETCRPSTRVGSNLPKSQTFQSPWRISRWSSAPYCSMSKSAISQIVRRKVLYSPP